ncbi:HD-GYP domain-containing protein [Streptomyces sp. NPDC014733]|uniref:HD-GYP domain-containing protein n=1 Tax=Streptomyces sp. NPDC014733 TaxID=3364885 RepID=UPI0036F5F96D
MRALPPAARGCITGAVLAAAVCAAPAVRLGPGAPWTDAAALAALHAGCETVRHRPLPGIRIPSGTAPFLTALPVLLAGVFLLPPPLAALTAVPGALLAPAEEPARTARRLWHAAELALACWSAALLFDAVAGPRPLTAPHFPWVLLPALAAATALRAVCAALDGAVRVTAEGAPPRTAWRGLLRGCLGPHLVHGLAGLMTAVLWRSAYGPSAALLVLPPMYLSCWGVAQYHQERAAHRATVRALVRAVDLKDRYTRGHGERVGRASMMIARELGLPEDRTEVLRIAGILHDVGKLGVPTRLLRKEGPLTDQERSLMELHPEYGHEIVRGIGFLGEAREAILHHHERLDGRGYPHGLKGAQIPECARVVAVADAFDAMTSTRSYRRARPVPAAVAELRKCAGKQFDPQMVRALAAALERHGWHPEPTLPPDAAPDPPCPTGGPPPGPRLPAPGARRGGTGGPRGRHAAPRGGRARHHSARPGDV